MYYNIPAEQAVLGMLLKDNEVILDIDLKPYHFGDIKHQKLFSIMMKLYQEGKKIDFINIGNEIKLDEVGGLSYLADLITYADITLDKAKIDIIKEKYKQRELFKIISKIKTEIENKPFQALINEMQMELLKIDDAEADILIKDKELFMDIIFPAIDEKVKSDNKIQGLRCNISSIDAMINGFQKGKLYFIAGRPGMGKSAVTINIANEIAKKHCIMYFSLEMTAEEIGLRRLASESYIDMAKIERGVLTEEELKKLNYTANRLYQNHMLINDTPALHINDIYRIAKKQKLRGKLDMLVVDHIGLVKSEGDTVREQVTNICIQLKNIAKELEIPVLALSQLNRGVEQRADKRPQLSDLKESSGIEENADVVMLLYRDEYYNAETNDKGIIELNIAKQRGGRTGTIKLMWKPEIQLVRGIM